MENKEKAQNTPNVQNETIKDPKTGKTIDRRKAFLLAGGAMMAGAGLNSIAEPQENAEILFDSDGDGIADVVITDTDADGIFDASSLIEPNLPSNPINEVQPWNPNTAPMVSPGVVNDNMSFSDAFAAARQELGPGGIFMWQGQYYSTFYAEELDDNNQPVVEYTTTDYHELPQVVEPTTNNNNTSDPIQVDNGMVNVNQTVATIDLSGSESLIMDSDNDGKIDAMFVDINRDGVVDLIFLDENQNNVFEENEIQALNDPANLQIPENPSDGSVMLVDLNADGKIDMMVTDLNNDQLVDAVAIDQNANQQFETSETNVLNPSALEGIINAEAIEYSGEVAADIPQDVPDEILNDMNDELSSLEDDFDELNQWA